MFYFGAFQGPSCQIFFLVCWIRRWFSAPTGMVGVRAQGSTGAPLTPKETNNQETTAIKKNVTKTKSVVYILCKTFYCSLNKILQTKPPSLVPFSGLLLSSSGKPFFPSILSTKTNQGDNKRLGKLLTVVCVCVCVLCCVATTLGSPPLLSPPSSPPWW
jgi:hypothetical protein